MAISAQAVKQLKELTNCGMMDCKRALEETNGDVDAAIKNLREKGLAKAAKKSGRIAAEGLVYTKIDEAKKAMLDGTLKVFDTSKFTVDGATLTEYLADVDGDFTGETNVIADGFFNESGDGFRSAPYFDIKYIDGISEM